MAVTMPNEVGPDDLIDAMKRLLKTSARMYMHLARETIATFGRDGEMTTRLGLRAYGAWRGSEMRQAHQALGLEINMRNLIGCWDNASTFLAKDDVAGAGDHRPYDTRFDVRYCPASEAWSEAGFFQWGHAYCDEFHQACAAAYHPDGNVVIPQNLMKGDDHCHFQWVMPPDARSLDASDPTELGMRLARDYRAGSDLEAAWLALKRSDRLVGGRFFVHAQAILDRHGEAGRLVLAEALKAWGRERGRLLAEDHDARGLTRSAANFVREHDMPARQAWNISIDDEGPHELTVTIIDTPHDQAWDDLSRPEMTDLFYSEAYPAMAGSYRNDLQLTWAASPPGAGIRGRLSLVSTSESGRTP